MKTLDMVRLAMSRLRTSRLRTALTMLGVIIGVASVVALVAVGQGTTANVTDRLAGARDEPPDDQPGVVPAGRHLRGGRLGRVPHARATPRRSTPCLCWPASRPRSRRASSSSPGDANTTTTIVGTTADYPAVRSYELWQGSGLTDASVETSSGWPSSDRRRRTTWASAPTPIGTEIEIGGLPFLVVGILQEKGGSGLPGPRRPGPHPGHDPPEVLLGLGRRPDDRRQRGLRPTPSRHAKPAITETAA